MYEVRKHYRRQVASIQKKIERRQKWLQSEAANKIDLLSGYDRNAVEREIFLLKQDLAEAKKALRLYYVKD